MTGGLTPATAAEVAEAVHGAAGARRRLLVRGGGTKIVGSGCSEFDAVLSVAELGSIVDYDPAELVLTAGPGAPLAEIESVLAGRSQQLAFEPGSAGAGATLGGAIACNDSGPRRVAAGAARDHFLGFAAVSGRGEPFKSGGRVVKNVTGYDLPKLLAGSWGTLAVLTQVTMRVMPGPEETATVLYFGLSDEAAVALLCDAAGSPHDPSGLAHLPPRTAARSKGAAAMAGTAVTALRIEGPVPSVRHRSNALRALRPAAETAVLDCDESRELWREIGEVGPLSHAPVLWRVSVPPAAGARTAAAIGAEADAGFLYDWAGGRLWAAILGSDPGESAVRAAVAARGGHATLARAPESVRREISTFPTLTPEVAAVQLRIKRGFDPFGILNPGGMGIA